MTLALLAATSGGCLIVDPVEPAEDESNTNPKFFLVQPVNETTVFLANTSTPVTFKARASDRETATAALVYEWAIDNGPPVQGPAADLTDFTTSGAQLGAGIHLVQVLVTDDGQPTGFVTLEWEVQVQ